MYDIPPPKNDEQAKQMAAKIRKWISQGRPEPGEEPKSDDSDDSDSEDTEKTKKKRSLFGRFRK